MVLSCRFYANRYPDEDGVVMVNVRSVAEVGVYVDLLEYDQMEGLILLNELSRRRIRSINKLIRVNRNEVVVVTRVDKGYIDLSKRRVSQEEVTKCEEKFAKAKAVNSVLRHCGELLGFKTDEELEQLYKKTAWMFDEKYKRQGAAFEAFKHAVTNPEILDECEVDENTKEVLLENIKRRLSPQSIKIRADVEVACTNYEGIDAVKRALKKGLELSTETMPIKINLIAPPLYVVITQTLERTDGIAALNKAIGAIKDSIEDAGGMFNTRLEPKVVSERDEVEFAHLLEDLEEENRDVSGDEDERKYDLPRHHDCR